ncbi:MAG: hypothetical protein ACYDC6_02915 [Acidobacteriaceae bacterium]
MLSTGLNFGQNTIDVPSFSRPGVRSNALNATLFPGSDIGAQINAALASCGGHCKVKVVVPQGNYSYAATIELPVYVAWAEEAVPLCPTPPVKAQDANGANVKKAHTIVRVGVADFSPQADLTGHRLNGTQNIHSPKHPKHSQMTSR